MLMQRSSMTKTTGCFFFKSEEQYLKIEILRKDNFIHWKLTVRGGHC